MGLKDVYTDSWEPVLDDARERSKPHVARAEREAQAIMAKQREQAQAEPAVARAPKPPKKPHRILVTMTPAEFDLFQRVSIALITDTGTRLSTEAAVVELVRRYADATGMEHDVPAPAIRPRGRPVKD